MISCLPLIFLIFIRHYHLLTISRLNEFTLILYFSFFFIVIFFLNYLFYIFFVILVSMLNIFHFWYIYCI